MDNPRLPMTFFVVACSLGLAWAVVDDPLRGFWEYFAACAGLALGIFMLLWAREYPSPERSA